MTQLGWQINTGEEVVDLPTGRIGRAVMVLRDEVWVRFEKGEKASNLRRRRIMPTRTVQAFREVDEDEANAKAYAEAMR